LTPPRRVSSLESTNGETRRLLTTSKHHPLPLAALSFSSLVPGPSSLVHYP
jgi:hypothetical protein